MERVVKSRRELHQVAQEVVPLLTPHPLHATLVTLSGELGAGKTSLTQEIARVLGVEESVTSPTFVLVKIYKLPDGPDVSFKRLVHIDAYRLKGANELPSLGFEEIMQDPENLVILEWPERVPEAIPAHALAVKLAADPGGTRTITWQ